MQKSFRTLFAIGITFFITLGLAIGLQGVFGIHIPGINIGRVLNLGENKITHVGPPTAAGDVATKGFVDSTFVPGGLYGWCAHGPGCSALSPAFCITPPSPGNCSCPPGYTVAWTGSRADGVWNFFSCHKN